MIRISIKNTAGIFTTALLLIACSFMPAFARSTVLCTTFPIYQITRNIAQADKNLAIELMLPNEMGCPHNYTLSPQDMKKIARADILIINGLGMEEFLNDSVQKENPQIFIIDSSTGISPTIAYTNDSHKGNTDHKSKDDTHANAAIPHDLEKYHADLPPGMEFDHSAIFEQIKEHEEMKKEDHGHHAGINPHLFASPRMAAQIAMNIATGLSKAHPEKADIYSRQAEKYEKTMNQLADEMAALGRKLENKKVIQPHGAFDYLARDMGLHIIATMQPHGQKPSASEMVHLVHRIKEKKVGAIFTEPQYPQNTGQTLSRETGVPVVIIDPVATGPANAPLDYYEITMRKNMKRIEKTMGTK